MNWIPWVLLQIQSGHDSVHRWTDGQTNKVKPVYSPPFQLPWSGGYNKKVTWSMFWYVLYNVSFPQNIQAVHVDGAQMRWGLSSPLDKDCPFWSGFMPVVHVEQHDGVVSFHYLPIIDVGDVNQAQCRRAYSRHNLWVSMAADELRMRLLLCQRSNTKFSNPPLHQYVAHVQSSFKIWIASSGIYKY